MPCYASTEATTTAAKREPRRREPKHHILRPAKLGAPVPPLLPWEGQGLLGQGEVRPGPGPTLGLPPALM